MNATQTPYKPQVEHGRAEIDFIKRSEDGDLEAILVSRFETSDGEVDETLLLIHSREANGPWQTVVRIDVDGVEHFGEGHNSDSAARHLYEVVTSVLPELRAQALIARQRLGTGDDR